MPTMKIRISPYYIVMILFFLNLLFWSIIIADYRIDLDSRESIILIPFFIYILHVALGWSKIKYKNWIWNGSVPVLSVICFYVYEKSLTNAPRCYQWMWCGFDILGMLWALLALIVVSLLGFHISKYIHKHFDQNSILKNIRWQSFILLILIIVALISWINCNPWYNSLLYQVFCT